VTRDEVVAWGTFILLRKKPSAQPE